MNLASVILPCNFNRTPPCMFFEEWTDIFWDIYLFSVPNNYCFDRAPQGQLPTVTGIAGKIS